MSSKRSLLYEKVLWGWPFEGLSKKQSLGIYSSLREELQKDGAACEEV